jgi:drug/metabolite transporter (DMT)-like permease
VSLFAALAARPRLAAVAGALAIAMSGVLYRWSGASPSTAVVFRCLYGLPILAILAVAESRTYGRMTRRTWGLAAFAGFLFACDLTTFHVAVDLIGAGLGTVMGNVQVLIVAFAAWALFGERPRRAVLLALPVILFGVVLISGVIGTGAFGANPGLGVAIGVVTATAYSGYLLVIRRASPDHRPAGPVAIATATTALTAAVFGLFLGNLDLVPSFPSHLYLAALGVVAQSFGYVAIQASLPKLPAVITSVLLLVQPVASVILGAVLLGEDPSAWQLAGVVLVITGIGLATGAVARIAAARSWLAIRAR